MTRVAKDFCTSLDIKQDHCPSPSNVTFLLSVYEFWNSTTALAYCSTHLQIYLVCQTLSTKLFKY